jgi:hypothetical protein
VRGKDRADLVEGMTVTLVSLSLILSLTIYEFVDYRRVHMVRPELLPEEGRRTLKLSLTARTQEPSIVVDRSRGEKLVVNLNIDFPRVPCYRELRIVSPGEGGHELTVLSRCSRASQC